MENTDEKKEPLEPLYDLHWDDDVYLEIWPAGRGFEVTVTCPVRRAGWWEWWRSDLPFPRGKRKDIIDALKYAQTRLSRRRDVAPSYMELKVTFAESD